MLLIKCIGGAIIGSIVTFLGIGVISLVLSVVLFILRIIFKHDVLTFDIPYISTRHDVEIFIYTCTALGAVVGFLVPIKNAANDDAQRKKAKDKSVKDEISSLKDVLEHAKVKYLSLSDLVISADAHLNTAEYEFKEGVFGSFWDEIENATNRLAEYNFTLKEIKNMNAEYSQRASKLDKSIPEFILPDIRIHDPRPVADRLAKIFRQAEKNFQFYSIYQQRIANNLLYTGFKTLKSAIEHMPVALNEMLSGVAESLHMRLDEIITTSNESNKTLDSIADRIDNR